MHNRSGNRCTIDLGKVSARAGIRAGHATDLWRIVIFDVGTPAYLCFTFKSGISRTLGVRTGVVSLASSDVVFSVTSSVAVVGKIF